MAEKQMPKPAGPSPNKISTLMELAATKTAGPKQGKLDLGIAKQAEINGLESRPGAWDAACRPGGPAIGTPSGKTAGRDTHESVRHSRVRLWPVVAGSDPPAV